MSSPISSVNVEKEILKTRVSLKTVSYLLVTSMDGFRVDAVFSDYDKALSYMVRTAVNDCRDLYDEYIEDSGESYSEESYVDFIRSQINDYNEIIPIHHIDINKPVYVMRSSSSRSDGIPSEYVTNSEVYWDAKMKSSYVRTKRERRDGVSTRVPKEIKDYLLKIDPPLPDLQQFIKHEDTDDDTDE